jgi:fucose 4-O-acetylase-like acetyltransferase
LIKSKHNPSQRIEFIDLLKSFAIFCVLWGHAIQYLRNGDDFSHNTVYEFIYSFHMPLFFMISGFFFKSSLKLNGREFFFKKFIQLLLPCFIWAVLFMGLRFGYNQCDFDWIKEIKALINPFKWKFWFLKTLFISYSIAFLSYKVLKKEWIVFICSLIFVLIVPCCERQRFLFPFFLIGIILKDNYFLMRKYLPYVLWSSCIVYISCLFFWDGDYSIYKTHFQSIINITTMNFDFSNMDISFFRFFTGLSGSVFFFTLFQTLYRKNNMSSFISKIGTYTLSIYILQMVVLENIMDRILDFGSVNILIYNFVVTPFVAIFVLCICLGIVALIKNNYLRVLLFGSTDKKNLLNDFRTMK